MKPVFSSLKLFVIECAVYHINYVYYPKRKDAKVYYIGCPNLPGICLVEHFKMFYTRPSK